MFDAYVGMGQENIKYTDILSGFASFIVVALGGTLIGIIWGFLTGFVTRFTNHVRVIEPIFIFVMSYLAYLNAEIFHMSGILAWVLFTCTFWFHVYDWRFLFCDGIESRFVASRWRIMLKVTFLQSPTQPSNMPWRCWAAARRRSSSCFWALIPSTINTTGTRPSSCWRYFSVRSSVPLVTSRFKYLVFFCF